MGTRGKGQAQEGYSSEVEEEGGHGARKSSTVLSLSLVQGQVEAAPEVQLASLPVPTGS